jgi:hypothetical protein
MANSNGWGDGAANNNIGWGQGANNAIGWGDIHADSWAGLTDIVGVTTDPDAQAFITAAAITNPTQQGAINNLVIGLKADSLWTKMKALYPFCGGSASSHKFNLKDPRDLDAAYRLVFSGGWTHSSTGATPNGTNGYANTYYNPSVNGQLNSAHLGFYSRTNNSNTEIEIGANAPAHFMCYFLYPGQLYCGINSSDAPLGNSISPSSSFLVGSRITSTTAKFYKNGIVDAIDNKTSTSRPNQNIYIGCLNNNGNPSFYSTKQCAFASIGDGLTDTDATNLNSRVTTFQTALNRNI